LGFATAKTSTKIVKIVKIMENGKKSRAHISYDHFNIIFILVVASFIASFRPILDLNSTKLVNVMQH